MIIKKMVMISNFALGLMLVQGSSVWADQLYKWVDASGTTHYSAEPPPVSLKSKTKIISIATQSSTSTSSSDVAANPDAAAVTAADLAAAAANRAESATGYAIGYAPN